MNLSNALKFPFRGAKPWPNILLLAVCNLIPIIGPIVCMGYGVRVQKMLLLDPNTTPPHFDFGKFGLYLERGVIPFVVALIVTLCYMPVVMICYAILFIPFFALRNSPLVMCGSTMLLFLMFIAFGLLVGIFMIAFILRASLEGNIGSAFKFSWALDFYKRVGWTAIGNLILLQLLVIPAAVVGMCALYFGIFVVLAIFNLVMWHVYVQLYQLYLDRGGMPLVIKEELPPPAFPVVTR